MVQALPAAFLTTVRCLTAMFLAGSGLLTAQDKKTPALTEVYTKRILMIPMRDGVKLYTEVYAPRSQTEALPIVFLRTPYRVAAPNGGFTRYFQTTFRELAKDRYIFAVQDARGRHGSQGEFEWNRPVRHHLDKNAIDASTDAYDSIAWMIGNIGHNNGRIGMLGVSYPGWYVTMALIDAHPALRAASPQASPSDYFLGDDFFHFGAFRLGPSAELPYLFDFDPKKNSRFPYPKVDTYEFFLELGPLSNMNKRYLKGVSPTWDNFMNHATYDEYWRAGATLPHLKQVRVPTLNVVGWWDAENLGGALDIYDKLEPLDSDGQNRIVVGPWAHGQWASGPREHLGTYQFGSDTTAFYQRQVEAPFFAHHLKGAPDPKLPEALMFQTGSNLWKRYQAWPPRNTQTKKLYLQAGGRLSFTAPTPDNTTAYASYTSDPAKPVPFSKRPIMGFWTGLRGSREARFQRSGKLWKVEDQRFVHNRPDVLSFVTQPLDQAVELTGRIQAHLFASTTGTDADWVVKLIDVYPENYHPTPEMGGYQLMVADDVLRGKFHQSFAKPQALVPGQVQEFVIDLRTRNHLFRKGHRIMVQIQSSWFPLIDRNPQTFVDIPKASAGQYRSAEHRIYFTPGQASHLSLGLAGRPR
jgi:putative CocE/NonD family hydrolase